MQAAKETLFNKISLIRNSDNVKSEIWPTDTDEWR